MGHWAGTTTLRASPVFDLLGQVTTPRKDALFLESKMNTSFSGCSAPLFARNIYNASFLGVLSSALIRDAAYNLTFLKTMEVILPIVDCTFPTVVSGAGSALRIFYLMRNKTKTDDVALLTFSASLQDYRIPKQRQSGAAAVATISLIWDMREAKITQYFAIAQGYPFQAVSFQVYTLLGNTVEHEWILESIPSNPLMQTPKELYTSRRTGFYINTEKEQSNVLSRYWAMDDDPMSIITQIRLQGGPVLWDSWSWVHFIHLLFMVDTLANVLVLFVVTYWNIRAGKIWIGDAFVTVSTTLPYRAGLILLSWMFNGFWTLFEFSFSFAGSVSKVQDIYTCIDIMHADLFTLFLGYSSLAGVLLRERIDPALTVLTFEIWFAYRVEIARKLPSTAHVLTQFAKKDYDLSTKYLTGLSVLPSPMGLWTIHPLYSRSPHLMFVALLPIFSSFTFILIFIIFRKIYRRIFPEKIVMEHGSGNSTSNYDQLDALKLNLTMFEVATGAELQKRVGVMSDYENCVYIKGVTYASADGIYCNGYVIANGKYLIATRDIWTIIMMKIVRMRFKNVYAYEVTGTTVQQTARLVYPETIAWRDLMRLNVSMLA
ncbi:hypothetical protein Poli38472_004217 [Pythium oligandrum]|uniref:Uncharacterized protein n=1 Tax=Pythium oligandrum TaxID=41045 RepID=A0A8K1FP17_PYTOL|nr:hypothetical protein Poli38472_004217 [Pythium oligandrum]|eukprot:TMW66452.1 hypothetical protein Poli38472_004217 [Pythium oligandrum]